MKDFNVKVINKNPDIIKVPSSITIPAGGNVDVTIDGLKEGYGTIEISIREVMITVFGNGTSLLASPVSIYIDTVSSKDAASVSPAVSTYIETSSGDGSTTSQSVSAYIETSSGDEITVSPSVSTQISL
ncbi:MAG: hypothetical protein HY755_02310 [Nitrospirae bacterium]|nr:hypothetical protein [Nitrospirota bacterium]